jgi:hypothetical protein
MVGKEEPLIDSCELIWLGLLGVGQGGGDGVGECR